MSGAKLYRFFAFVVVFLTAIGCRPEKPIEVSTYEKPAELMMVGVMLRGDTLWSIKLVGSRQKILDAEDSVYEFAKSLDFLTDPTDPRWKVPRKWLKLDLEMNFRKATFEILDDDDESKRTHVILSEIRMGQNNMPTEDSIVANINRWRKEMNAEEIINFGIDEEGRTVGKSAASLVIPFMKKIMIDEYPMYFDKIEGVYQKKSTRGMKGLPGGGPMAGHPKINEGLTKKAEPPKTLPFKFEQPKSWKTTPPGSFAKLKFIVGEGEKMAQVSISKFPGDADDVNWFSTVTMWQGFLKVPKSKKKNLHRSLKKFQSATWKDNWLESTGSQKKMALRYWESWSSAAKTRQSGL